MTMTSRVGEMKANLAVSGTSNRPSCMSRAAWVPNSRGDGDAQRVEPDRHADRKRQDAQAQQADGKSDSRPHRREFLRRPSEQPDAENLDVGGKRHRDREREAGAGKRHDQAARQRVEPEALEHGFEHVPLADKAGLRRHGGKAHRGKQRAQAEQPRTVPQQIGVNDAVAAGRADKRRRR